MSSGQSLATLKKLSQNSDILQNVRHLVQENLDLPVSSSHSSPNLQTEIVECAKKLMKEGVIKNFEYQPWINPLEQCGEEKFDLDDPIAIREGDLVETGKDFEHPLGIE